MNNEPLNSREGDTEEESLQEPIECANQPYLFNGNCTLTKGNEWKGDFKQYGLSIQFETKEGVDEVKYELSVEYFGLNEDRNNLFQVDRTSPVYVNEILPDLLADKLAYHCGQIFYPLLIETDHDGRLLEIKNIEQIRERWLELIPEIESTYAGEYVSKYIELMNMRLEDDHFIHISIQEDWFIQTYFQSIYKDYPNELSLEEHIRFAHLTQATLGYKTIQRLNPLTNHFGSIELEHIGQLELNDENSTAGSYQAKYYLHPISKAIQAIIAQWENEEQTIRLELYTTDSIKNEVIPYHLLPENRPSIIVDSTDAPKKGFWGRLFS